MPQPQSVVSLHQLCLFELPGEELLNLTVDMIEERFLLQKLKTLTCIQPNCIGVLTRKTGIESLLALLTLFIVDIIIMKTETDIGCLYVQLCPSLNQ